MKIAVLMTCHNRREKTLACLEALFSNDLPEGISLKVFLVDDGSTDGTADAVAERFSDVKVIKGDGSLFWNGGMRLAFDAASQGDFDHYLWLNDDTILYPAAISVLLETQEKLETETGKSGIAVGSTCDDAGKLTYGGKLQLNRLKPLNFSTIQPADEAIPCDTMNGNCVLVSREAAARLGNLDAAFVHTIGDIDYGLRAREIGIPMLVVPGFLGVCNNDNIIDDSCLGDSISLKKRFKAVCSPKRFPPRAWFLFCLRHGGGLWPLLFISPYLKVIKSSF